MKKSLLTLITLTILFVGCKKKDDTVAIDMTLKTYLADAKPALFPYTNATLELKFQSNGTVVLRVPPFDDYVTLKYEVVDKMATNTNLHIYGELDKKLMAYEFNKDTNIDWNATIGRLGYKPEIIGFQAEEYHFTSY
ncbi:hypothetical protein ABDJ41_12035 [Pedobacter sp. ASV1-7]|uniref:hypothetical protein n=1 Tax=Pedobacter sp. ASV1-7 TaxID=3145237 RepID=UPI0032E8AFBC